MHIDQELYEFATPRQREILDAVELHGGKKQAARALGLNRTTVRDVFRSVQRKSATMGYSPEHDMTHTVPDGFSVKGVSTYYNREGQPTGQWVKSSADEKARFEIAQKAIEALCQTVPPLPPIAAPQSANRDLMTVIPMGDPHFGLMSWAAETGDNFDLDTAEELTYAAIDRLTERSPASGTAMLLNLGDFFHADNSTNTTPKGNNGLDVDGRYAKIAMVSILSMQRCVMRMLEKHDNVIVKNLRGNHDIHSYMLLTTSLFSRFMDNPRVTVDLSPSPYYYYQFGKNLIGASHGDGAKMADLPLLMANDRPMEWAASRYRVWHTGHVHHDQVKDLVGCRVESHRTLASSDAWHNWKGYRSMRDMKAIVYEKEYGEEARIRCGVEMVG